MDPKEQFYRQFHLSAANIREQIEVLPTLSTVGGERLDATTAVRTAIARLSNEVADAAEYVPAYDQRAYSDAVKALTDQLNAATAKAAPRVKFQFKPKVTATSAKEGGDNTANDTNSESRRDIPSIPNASSEKEEDQQEQRDAVPELPSLVTSSPAGKQLKDYNSELASASPNSSRGPRKPSFSQAHEISLSDLSHMHIILPASAAKATSSGALTNLDSCVVDLSVPTRGDEEDGTTANSTSSGSRAPAPFANLVLRDVRRCLLVAGRVNGPAHITGVRDSVVVVAARQVRIHECEGTDVYLWCGSHPVVEDCKGLRFAPAPRIYLTDEEDEARNQWDQVEDFKWLKSEPSPNWSVLPAGERLSDEVWETTVPGGPGKNAHDILKAIGVRV